MAVLDSVSASQVWPGPTLGMVGILNLYMRACALSFSRLCQGEVGNSLDLHGGEGELGPELRSFSVAFPGALVGGRIKSNVARTETYTLRFRRQISKTGLNLLHGNRLS